MRKFLFLFFAISSVLLIGSRGFSQKKTQYDLLESSGSGIYTLKKENVSKKMLKGEYYRIKTFSDGKLTSIAHYNYKGKKPKLFDSHYDAAIIKFKYTKDGKPQKVSFFNEKKKLSEQSTFGCAVLEYAYDSTGKIVKEFRKDSKNKPVKSTSDSKNGAVIEYIYMGDSIQRRVLDENNKVLEESFTSQKPCVPYIDCPRRF